MPKASLAALLLCLFLPPLQSLGQSTFRVEELSSSEIVFIIPPKSKLKLKGDAVERKYAYHDVKITDLAESYAHSSERVRQAEYRYVKAPKSLSQGDDGFVEEGCEKFCRVRHEGKYGFVLRIDYQKLFAEGDVVGAFDGMGRQLLIYFSTLEEDNAWAYGISLDIVDKVFASIPTPRDAALAKFGFTSDEHRTVFLLSPKLTLQVDLAQLIEPDGQSFQYDFVGQAYVNFYRRQVGEKNPALLEYRAFPNVSRGVYPPNSYDPARGLVLLSSSADIQMSSTTNIKRFIAFYEGTVKRNNDRTVDDIRKRRADDERIRQTLYNKCDQMRAAFEDITGRLCDVGEAAIREIAGESCPGQADEVVRVLQEACAAPRDDDDDPCAQEGTGVKYNDCAHRQSSFLLFSNKIDDFYSDRSADEAPKGVTKAIFGPRSIITPLISIWVNGQLVNMPLKSTVGDLLQTGKVPRRFKLFRAHRDGYAKVSSTSPLIILLPGDRISF